MLKVLLLFVLLIAGIVVGPMIAGHQGYVLIQTDNYNIETSVTALARTPVGGLSGVSVAVHVSRPNRRC